MTDSEQEKINQACHDIDNEKAGWRMDRGRSLSRAEINELVQNDQITPVWEIPFLGRWQRVDSMGSTAKWRE